ncbi:het-domain-containing protein [Moniliophthora roreri]|uniref:Heterokaryon incompatibility domain-containing protein n=1 Tax=Moniliophthora roreri TaxID=221103 RepID=A0A0W0GEW9_MONRR|nr:het-domain-containing protein [Moniliophthora roreri]
MRSGKVIFEIRLETLGSTPVDLTQTASDERYRLIDCQKFARDQILSIEEFDSLFSQPFAAISYIWRGNPPNASSKPSSFSVKGAEYGDPITLEVLHHGCMAAMLEGAEKLWLDRLCILQTSRMDKAWQIMNMSSIYRHCVACIVLPGGLARLVDPTERTDWINRAWTLQEVTLPKKSIVLFAWSHGSVVWRDYELMSGIPGDSLKVPITEVIPEQSAVAPVTEVLKACFHFTGSVYYDDKATQKGAVLKVNILGPSRAASVASLLWTLEANHPIAKETAIWQSAILRTSSRPVDMIFSIMHLFNVTLNPLDFGKNDRIGATIALAKEILRSGGKPAWLGATLDIRPSQYISSFPELPQTHVEGVESVGWTMAKSNFFNWRYGGERGPDMTSIPLSEPGCWMRDMPSGEMDDEGYLSICTRATPVRFTGQVLDRQARFEIRLKTPYPECVTKREGDLVRVITTDGEIWEVLPNEFVVSESSETRRGYILFIGSTCSYPGEPIEVSLLKNIVIEEHLSGKFHRIATWSFSKEMLQVIDLWEERTFAIGGPQKWPAATMY